ncbi:hypothetical protein TSUD_373260 [Trifolium subterraneum]|uniref:DUF4005 domain-containing protein n=1 Tax=Trifolium subterraneum TaxID=3900 RepID=A0A2Z6NJT9_TRISU|nr:hypothetical protein TSUD_373260 [Trifolium subterraneum]
MGKKGWFSIVKKLFTRDTHSTQDKKEKRRKWVFGRLKNKRFPSIEAPPPLKGTSLFESEEEHSKHALTVATAAAEAALTAAQVAVEVVRLQSAHQFKRKLEARKALRALKGIVMLQSIIRGRAVRRQAMSTLKCLQSIVSIQSQVIARKLQMVEGRFGCGEYEEMQGSSDKIIRMDSNSERKWDKEVNYPSMSNKEASLRKERVKEYSYHHRKSTESERNKINGRGRYWMDTQHCKSKELEDLDSVFSSHCRVVEDCESRQQKLIHIQRQNEVEGLDSRPILSSKNSLPQRSHNLEGEYHSFPSSPAIPTYMVATKSTQAKVRSTSPQWLNKKTPLRPTYHTIGGSGGNTPTGGCGNVTGRTKTGISLDLGRGHYGSTAVTGGSSHSLMKRTSKSQGLDAIQDSLYMLQLQKMECHRMLIIR